MANNKTKLAKRTYTDEQRKERAVIRRLIRQGRASRYSFAKDPVSGALERQPRKAKGRPRLTFRQITNLK